MGSHEDHCSRAGAGAVVAALAASLLVTACAPEDEEPGTSQHAYSCPQWACGSNHPMVNNIAAGELNLDGQPGHGGFRILLAQSLLGLPLQLDVHNGELIGTGLLGVKYQGAALIGSRIILENLTNLSLHAIVIIDFGHVPSWTDLVKQVPAYHLLSSTLSLDLQPITFGEVCGAVLSSGGLTPLARHYAVLVHGERYDPEAKTITATGGSASRWFNIACNGSALAKMKLLGYDPTYTGAAATTPAQRQATLKMLTADYCGTGTSFTVMGEPLRWYNRGGSAQPFPDLPAATSSEAVWTAGGALCLDTPRRADDDPDITAAIAAECGAPLPTCDELTDDWTQLGEWRTENTTAP